MNPSPIAYFSKMFQAVPQLMEVQKHAGGSFVSNRRSTLAAARRLYPQVPMDRYGSWLPRLSAGYRVLRDARAIVTGAPGEGVLSQFEARDCMVFHGTYMFLSRQALERMRHFDLLCTIGPRMQHTIARYRDQFDFRTIESGYLPFGSFPEKSAQATADGLLRLGLSPQRQTLVYMPWGKPHGSWLQLAERLVRETPADYNLILRPHPSQGLTARRDDRASFRRVSELCRARANTLLDINACTLAQLFSLADLMLTDGTSPAEESLFYDVPQLFVETPLWTRDVIRQYARDSEGTDAEDLERYLTLFDCGITYRIDQPRPLREAIERALADADSLRDKRAAYFHWVFGPRDRAAGARVHQALLELIN